MVGSNLKHIRFVVNGPPDSEPLFLFKEVSDELHRAELTSRVTPPSVTFGNLPLCQRKANTSFIWWPMQRADATGGPESRWSDPSL